MVGHQMVNFSHHEAAILVGLPQFSFRTDSTESLNIGEFISSDSLIEISICFNTWFWSSGYIPAALNLDIKFIFKVTHQLC